MASGGLPPIFASDYDAPSLESVDYLCVSGLIGVGKSTLARGLADHTKGVFAEEPNTINPYLRRFYDAQKVDGENAWAFRTQIRFVADRFAQLKSIQDTRNTGQIVIGDRSAYEDVLFARMLCQQGKMSEEDFDTYSSLFRTMSAWSDQSQGMPNIVLMLDAPPSRAIERIKHRDRTMESGISIDYLRDLAKQYEQFAADMGQITTVFRLNWNWELTEFPKPSAVWEALKRQYSGQKGVFELAM